MKTEALKQLILPTQSDFQVPSDGGRFKMDYEQYQQAKNVWKINIVRYFEASLKAIMEADEAEKAIPRNAVLVLAVTTNQIRRYLRYWNSRFKDLDKKISRVQLEKAEELCKRFKVLSLMKASDYTQGLPPRRSKLDEKIDYSCNLEGDVHCRRCGRRLTNNVSVRRGVGPVCWKKIGGRY